MEAALKEQIDMIHELSEKVASQGALVDRLGNQLDNNLNRLREDLRSEFTNGDESLKSLFKFLETDQNN